MSEQERQVPEKAAAEAAEPVAAPEKESSAEERSESPMGRLGRAVSRFDESLSGRVPDAIEDASRRTADSTRKTVQSGLWQNYAFFAVVALVVITGIVLLARGCGTGVTP